MCMLVQESCARALLKHIASCTALVMHACVCVQCSTTVFAAVHCAIKLCYFRCRQTSGMWKHTLLNPLPFWLGYFGASTPFPDSNFTRIVRLSLYSAGAESARNRLVAGPKEQPSAFTDPPAYEPESHHRTVQYCDCTKSFEICTLMPIHVWYRVISILFACAVLLLERGWIREDRGAD